MSFCSSFIFLLCCSTYKPLSLSLGYAVDRFQKLSLAPLILEVFPYLFSFWSTWKRDRWHDTNTQPSNYLSSNKGRCKSEWEMGALNKNCQMKCNMNSQTHLFPGYRLQVWRMPALHRKDQRLNNNKVIPFLSFSFIAQIPTNFMISLESVCAL